MQCPLCIETVLEPHVHGGVEIDICPKCKGVWLDRGELDKLATSPPALARDSRDDDSWDDDDDDDDDDRDRSKKSSKKSKKSKKRKKSFGDRLSDVLEDVLDFD
jgi:Zn-finger nucleic acid-binding protein